MRTFVEAVKRAVVATVIVLFATAVIVGILVGIMFLLAPIVGNLASGIIALVFTSFLIILVVELL